jgi:shikimate kinase
MKNNSVTLIGMAGSGKSSTGIILAEILNWKYVDLDKLILDTQGITHHDYMEQNGEIALSDLENKLTLNLNFENLVFAPPGSIIYAAPAMKKIKQNSTIIYLETEPETIEKRIGNKLYKNGILGLKEKGLKKLMEERAVFYNKYADFTFHSKEETPQEMANIIINVLKEKNTIIY